MFWQCSVSEHSEGNSSSSQRSSILSSLILCRIWCFLYQCDRSLTINRTEKAVKANWVIKILNILGFMGRKADKASFVILFPWICFIFHFYFLGRRDTDRTHSSLSGASPALTNTAAEGQARTSTFQCNCFASAISFYHSWCKWRQWKGPESTAKKRHSTQKTSAFSKTDRVCHLYLTLIGSFFIITAKFCPWLFAHKSFWHFPVGVEGR